MESEVCVGAQGAGGFVFEQFLSKAGEGFAIFFATRERVSIEQEGR